MSDSLPPRYGHRHEILHNKQGSPFNVDTPLAAEDFLDPRPGDVFYHGAAHDELVANLRGALRRLFRTNPTITVLSQVRLVLLPPASHHPMPDLMVVENLPSPTRPRTVLDLAREGVVPACVIEITSPLFRRFDLDVKPRLYAEAGIEEYIVLDLGTSGHETSKECVAKPTAILHRLAEPWREGGVSVQTAQGGPSYTRILPDARGRLASKVLGTEIEAGDGTFYVIDPISGQRLEPRPGDEESLSATQAEGRFRAQSIAARLKL